MPASEIHYWEEYFSIYPFTFIREDIRQAELLSMVYNTNLMLLKQNSGVKNKRGFMSAEEFLPDYLSMGKNEKSIDEQKKEALAFAANYKLNAKQRK